MDYRAKFVVAPGKKLRLSEIDPSYTGKHISREEALPKIQKHTERMAELQYLLYADGDQALLIVLQALDAGGKDGTIRHLFAGMNPQGTSVFGFKQPTPIEAAHDFLWRAHKRAPAQGEVAIFNRSHYEDVLVVRVHKLTSPAFTKAVSTPSPAATSAALHRDFRQRKRTRLPRRWSSRSPRPVRRLRGHARARSPRSPASSWLR